jgi:hypothetical protein
MVATGGAGARIGAGARTGHASGERLASARMVEAQPQPAPVDAASDEPRHRAARGWLTGLAAFVVYAIASVLIYAGSDVAHLDSIYLARQNASDSEFFRWALVWTPWALQHGQNPLFTNVLYAPNGASLVWVTATPGPAFVMWPVTRAFGPLVSYNVLSLLAPALAAWATYLLCNRLTSRFWASLVAGAFFGFSAYMTIQTNHPNLSLVFPIPLAVYLTVRRLEGSLGKIGYVALLSATMLALWWTSIEVFATATLMAGIAFGIALVFAGERRRELWPLALLIGASYAIVLALVLFPYLLPALREAPTSLAVNPEHKYSDLLRFVLPRDRQLVGGEWLSAYAARVIDVNSAGVSYVGIGAVAVVLGYAFTERRRRQTWALVAFLLVAGVLALGPALYVGNRRTISLPEALLSKVPLIRQALPGRLIIYADLALAIVAAVWLAAGRGRWAWVRWAIVGLALLLIIPNVASPPYRVPDVTPAFFENGAWSGVLSQDETVVVIAQKKAQDMASQAETDMWFRLPDGYLGAVPALEHSAFDNGVYAKPQPPPTKLLGIWMQERGVTAIVVMDEVRSWCEASLRELGYAPVYEGDGVSVWRTA